MAMDFSDQQTLLSTLLGDSETDTDDMFPLARRKAEINRGEVVLARRTKAIREVTTGTVASKEISVPSDWLETFSLIVDNKNITIEREISPMDWERYQDWSGNEPYYYFWEESGTRKIKFLASTGVNGASYRLFYFKKQTTDMSDDTDTSLFPDEYREASVYYAAGTLLNQIGQHQRANRYLQVFENYVRQIQEDVEKQHITYERAMPDRNIVDPSLTDRQGVGFWW